MKNNLTLFQIIILGIFGALALGGMVYFATGTYGSSSGQVGEVLIWGTLDDRVFNAVMRDLAEDNPALLQTTYVEKPIETFSAELSEAIASGRGPDLYVLQSDYILKDFPKIFPFLSAGEKFSISERVFKDTFIDGAELFWSSQGALGIPIAVDPMVLFWNRDLLATAGFAEPPTEWEDLFDIAERATRRDSSKSILKSAIALG